MTSVITPITEASQALVAGVSVDYFWLFTLLLIIYLLARTNLRNPYVYIFALFVPIVIVVAKTGFALVPPWVLFLTIVGVSFIFLQLAEILG